MRESTRIGWIQYADPKYANIQDINEALNYLKTKEFINYETCIDINPVSVEGSSTKKQNIPDTSAKALVIHLIKKEGQDPMSFRAHIMDQWNQICRHTHPDKALTAMLGYFNFIPWYRHHGLSTQQRRMFIAQHNRHISETTYTLMDNVAALDIQHEYWSNDREFATTIRQAIQDMDSSTENPIPYRVESTNRFGLIRILYPTAHSQYAQETWDRLDQILTSFDWKHPLCFRAHPNHPIGPPPPKEDQSNDTHSYISTIVEFQQDIDEDLLSYLKIDKDRNPIPKTINISPQPKSTITTNNKALNTSLNDSMSLQNSFDDDAISRITNSVKDQISATIETIVEERSKYTENKVNLLENELKEIRTQNSTYLGKIENQQAQLAAQQEELQSQNKALGDQKTEIQALSYTINELTQKCKSEFGNTTEFLKSFQNNMFEKFKSLEQQQASPRIHKIPAKGSRRSERIQEKCSQDSNSQSQFEVSINNTPSTTERSMNCSSPDHQAKSSETMACDLDGQS